MTVQDVTRQYVIELPEHLRGVAAPRRDQLLEANGTFPRVAEPAEITGAWAGVMAAWCSGSGRSSQFTDLLNPRATT